MEVIKKFLGKPYGYIHSGEGFNFFSEAHSETHPAMKITHVEPVFGKSQVLEALRRAYQEGQHTSRETT